jgi:hypothetical protein
MSKNVKEQFVNSCKQQLKKTYSKYKNRNIVIFGGGVWTVDDTVVKRNRDNEYCCSL